MDIRKQIEEHISGHKEPKRSDLLQLHDIILRMNPSAKLWFLDGKNGEGKVVSNPNIGYGSLPHKYADGSISEFYQIGLTATSSGISVYIMGIEDKKYLAEAYAAGLGKASVTGYCIRFKTLKDINTEVLKAAIAFGFEKRREIG